MATTHDDPGDELQASSPDAPVSAAPSDDAEANVPDRERGRLGRILSYVPHALPRVSEVVLITAIFIAGFGLGGLLTGPMLDDGQVGGVSGQPLWDKVAYSYVALLLFLVHVKLLRTARDADEEVEAGTDTPIGRGEVRKGDLDMAAIIVIAIEGTVLANVGELRLWTWVVAVGLSLLMRVDFGARAWMRRHLVVRSILHGLVYAVVMAMLVALAFEAGINLGLVRDASAISVELEQGGGFSLSFPGLTPLDLLTLQVLPMTLIYLAGVAIGMARDLGQEVAGTAARSRTSMGCAIVAAALMAATCWLLVEPMAALPVVAAGVAGIAAARIASWRGWSLAGSDLVIILACIAAGTVGLVELGWLPWLDTPDVLLTP